MTRRFLGLALLSGVCLAAVPALARMAAQDKAPTRREFTVVVSDYRFSPERLEVSKDEIVRLVVQSKDVAYSLTIDEYRVSKRIPAGGSVSFEFRADKAGTFVFYSNLTSDPRHERARGQLVVSAR